MLQIFVVAISVSPIQMYGGGEDKRKCNKKSTRKLIESEQKKLGKRNKTNSM